MKCLSLKQPYAFLLSSGKKTIELRKWNTKFRGEFLIHAAKNIDLVNCTRLKIDKSKLITGALVGSSFLYDVKKYDDKQEFINDSKKHFAIENRYLESYKYGFLVRNAKLLEKPIHYPGKLGFFQVSGHSIPCIR